MRATPIQRYALRLLFAAGHNLAVSQDSFANSVMHGVLPLLIVCSKVRLVCAVTRKACRNDS